MTDTLPAGYPFTRVPKTSTKEGKPSKQLAGQRKRRKQRSSAQHRRIRPVSLLRPPKRAWNKSADMIYTGPYEHLEVQIKKTLDEHPD